VRFQGKHPPKTAAQRQAKCRAIKRGTYKYCQEVPLPPLPPGMPIPTNPNLLPHVMAEQQRLALAAPANAAAPPALPAAPAQRALPSAAAPPAPATGIQKSLSSDSRSLALLGGEESDGGPRLCLPAGVAARLRSLLDKHQAGKTLTAGERAEAEGLLDIAEYFAVQRLRQRFAA
jgi:hypothetical protein